MRRVAVVAFAQTEHTGHDTGARRGRADPARHQRGQGAHRADPLRLHLLGELRLPRRRAVLVRLRARRARRLAADLGEPRRDGRRVGAVRGVGAAAARRRRHRPGVRLRQVVARRPARDHDAPARPVLPGAARPRPGLLRRPAGPRHRRRPQGARRDRRGAAGPTAGATRTRWTCPNRAGRATPSSRSGPSTSRPITDGAAAIVLAAGDLAERAVRQPGVDHRHRAPHRAALPGHAGPVPARRRRPTPHGPRESARARSRWPSCTPSSPTRS